MQSGAVICTLNKSYERSRWASDFCGRDWALDPATRRGYENRCQFSPWTSWISRPDGVKRGFCCPNFSRWPIRLSHSRLKSGTEDERWWGHRLLREEVLIDERSSILHRRIIVLKYWRWALIGVPKVSVMSTRCEGICDFCGEKCSSGSILSHTL